MIVMDSVLLVTIGLWVRQVVRHAAAVKAFRRLAARQCPACGYDQRPSKNCPCTECGCTVRLVRSVKTKRAA
ncbi:MAG: hypothetical protein AAF108_01735 [Planctomycetota bacterium]